MHRFVAKAVAFIPLILLCGILLSCGGNKSSITAPPIPNIAGPWEFIAISSSGTETGIEVALQEGQVLVNGLKQPDGQINASSTQIAFVNIDTSSQNLNITGFGGNCPPTSTPTNGLGPGTVSALGAPIAFTVTENGNVFNVTGTLSGDGKSILNGAYTSQAGSSCADNGAITGGVVPKLSGSYAGQLTLPDGTIDTATATLSENSSATLNLSLVVTGTDNTTLTLTGPVTGNAFSVTGTFQGQTVSYYGYYELIYDSTLQINVPSIYFVNATNPAQPAYAGTLAVPQT